MIKVLGLDIVIGMPQLFIKKVDDLVVLLLAKYVDDLQVVEFRIQME